MIRQSGFVAQDVEKAMTESGYDFNGVHKPADDNDNYSVSYSLFVVPLVKAVQELNDKNKALQQDNKDLKENNTLLQQQIDAIKADVEALKRGK